MSENNRINHKPNYLAYFGGKAQLPVGMEHHRPKDCCPQRVERRLLYLNSVIIQVSASSERGRRASAPATRQRAQGVCGCPRRHLQAPSGRVVGSPLPNMHRGGLEAQWGTSKSVKMFVPAARYKKITSVSKTCLRTIRLATNPTT